MQKRGIDELVNKTEPAWPMIQDRIKKASNTVTVLPASEPDRSDALVATQVTTRSPMGAVVYETGGILVDHGWIRIMGSGHDLLPRSLANWNSIVGNPIVDRPPPFLLIADDVIGGFFAIDGGGLGNAGNVFYFAPDSLRWEDTGFAGYGGFLDFVLKSNLNKFYSTVRWPGWEAEVATVKGDQGILIYPFVSADGPAISDRDRSHVPMTELFGLFVIELPKQLKRTTKST